MTRILAVDVGTSAVKAALVVDGAVADAVTIEQTLDSPRPGWAEQDPDRWVATARWAIGELVHRGGDIVDAIAVTGQMQDLVPLDESGQAVRPAILYSDTRASAEHDELVGELGPAWPAAIGASPDPTNLAAKWRWLCRHEPDTVAETAVVVVGAHSAVVRDLTGAAVTDPTTAATTGLYALDAGTWWPRGVTATGIPLAPIRAATSVAGTLSPDVAAGVGLPSGVPVVHANGDAVATTVGILGTELGRPYAYLGTSGWVAVATQRPLRAEGTITLPGFSEAHWVTVAPMPTAGAAIDWARRELLGGLAHDELDALAASTCAIDDGVLFIPHLEGTRAPIAASNATGALIGVRRSSTAATIAAAIYEGVAHGVRQLLDAVAPSAPVVAVCGGASTSAVLRQTLADVTGAAVTVADDQHASLRGAAHAAHIAIGAPAIVPPGAGETSQPVSARAELHRRCASVFSGALTTMLPLMTALVEIGRDGPDTGGTTT